ncbi:MAG: hypothetical protein R6V58_13210 [Planctomycetota bacterium]
MAEAVAVASLPPAGRRLVRLMQEIRFGRIGPFPVRDGEPDLGESPKVIREVKFGGANGTHPKAGSEDFALKSQVVDLFAEFEQLGDGFVLWLEVKHGLPFRMAVEGDAAI